MRVASFPHAFGPESVQEPVGVVERAAVEHEQLAALRSGDPNAFARLLAAWSPAMLRVARSFVRTSEAAEDVVQETWLAVVVGLDRFEGRSSLRTWVFAILANQARTYAVRAARVIPSAELEALDSPRWTSLPTGAPEADPEQDALYNELTALLVDALAQIPPRQALTVTLRDLHGVDARDACVLMSVSPRNHRVLLHRGRAAVRAPLEAYLSA